MNTLILILIIVFTVLLPISITMIELTSIKAEPILARLRDKGRIIKRTKDTVKECITLYLITIVGLLLGLVANYSQQVEFMPVVYIFNLNICLYSFYAIYCNYKQVRFYYFKL